MKQFLADNPVIAAVFIVPLLGALFTALFHPRNSEEFTKHGVRIGALLKLVASVTVDAPKAADATFAIIFGQTTKDRSKAFAALLAALTFDPRKFVEGVYQLVTGRDLKLPTPPPDDPPANDNGDGPRDVGAYRAIAPRVEKPSVMPPPPAARMVLMGLASVILLIGCKPAETPREQARGTILTIAFAVRAANDACSTMAERTRNVDLATSCADAFDAARDALSGAESAVDAWDRGTAGDVSCAVARGVSSLTSIVSAVRRAGGNLPPVVDDAMRLAPLVTGVCRG